MKFLAITHDFEPNIGGARAYTDYSVYPAVDKVILSFKCRRCGFVIETEGHDIIKNILTLTQQTCELKYEEVKELLNYIAVKETHES